MNVPNASRKSEDPNKLVNNTNLLPCLFATSTQSKEVINWDKKKVDPTIPHQNPTADSPPPFSPAPTPIDSSIKNKKGPAVEAERNSEKIRLERNRAERG